MKNRKTNFIKLGILLFGISILLFNCEKEETIINQSTESLENDIFLNKTYSKIKEELNVQIDLKNNFHYQNKNNNVKFETKFGKPFYKKAFTIDTEFNTVIIPTQNVNNKKLKGWLSGYYVNGEIINFRYIFATKEEIEKIDIEQLITQESQQKSKIKSNYNAKGCTLYFVTKCVGFHFPGVGESDWVCKEYFAGANCTTDQPTLEKNSWINPLEERQGGGGSGVAIDNDYCNKLGLVYDPVLQTCVEDETYFCDCNCEGSETEFTNDLANNMEPKWGQLANKLEILNEIKSIPNLNSLSFENQILELENHFNKNLMYSNSLPIVILNPNDDINKYIFTKTVGWLDFHHIFKLFKWTNNKGSVNALLAGEMGELLQSLKGNYSAYSYEDLPSNNVGVALYIRFGKQLKEGTISWEDAVGKALDEMKWTQPEDAPNIDYIPFLLKDNYPKNFTYQPLLGERLKEYHKYEFCKLKKSQQENIKSVHEKFRR